MAGSGPTKQTINYSTERIVGNGSFGVVFQATCLESGETVSPTAYQDERAASHRRVLQLHSAVSVGNSLHRKAGSSA